MSVGVVTGASSGMGRACVEEVRSIADQVVAVDLQAPDIEGTIGVACDVSDPAGVRALVDQVAALGPFRALAHAAGLSPTMSGPRRIIDVNLVGTARLLDAFEPLVVAGSAAVCFASMAGNLPLELLGDEVAGLVHHVRTDDFLDRAEALIADPGMAYAFSKRGVQLEAASAAVRWGPKGGRVMSMSPGLIDTPMGRRELERQPVMQEMLDITPVGRLGTAEELAAVVGFMLSDKASFLSGVDLLVDGGLAAANVAKFLAS